MHYFITDVNQYPIYKLNFITGMYVCTYVCMLGKIYVVSSLILFVFADFHWGLVLEHTEMRGYYILKL